MHVASHTLSICQFLVIQAVDTSLIMVGNMDLIRSWIMHSNRFFSSYWVADWSNSLIIFSFFFCHYFMYPNNNLHQKLAVSEILNNVSLSLSIYFGDPIATSCVLLFIYFLDGCIMSTNGWRKKNFLYKIGIFFLFYFILFCIFSSKSKQSFSLNCLKDCPCQQQVTIGSTVKGVTLWNFIWNFVLWWY